MCMSAVTGLYTSQSLSDRVAAEVRGHAARMGIYQKDLAKALGIHPSQISGRMRGRVAFTLDDIEILAGLFGVDPADLMPRANSFHRSAEPAGALPRMDSNHQPFEYKELQVIGGYPIPEVREGSPSFGGSVVPLFAPYDPRWTADPKPATRPIPARPFRPVVVRVAHSVAV